MSDESNSGWAGIKVVAEVMKSKYWPGNLNSLYYHEIACSDEEGHYSGYIQYIGQVRRYGLSKIQVNNNWYNILEVIFSSHSLVGHDTVCYLVRKDDQEYIIKVHWVLGNADDENILNEVIILKKMQVSISLLPNIHIKVISQFNRKHMHENNYAISEIGTVPFMSQQLLLAIESVKQDYSDDLESLFYIFSLVCIGCSVTLGMEHHLNTLKAWLPHAWSNQSIAGCFDNSKAAITMQFDNYFKDFILLGLEWMDLLRLNFPVQVGSVDGQALHRPIEFDALLKILDKHIHCGNEKLSRPYLDVDELSA
ncbi:uncharacterized protein F5891DRAFT_986206 [Suillus fuscotomentosus]|uniref:Fungal-type protein kinase domain-containing protein n=1 Tax=Suillus fuscotomentosus TaxID=1912939 RepID=A0AAD4DSD3_9AGAM|nr:uncharacterized protein F5891DRAFT_986206 [Suillus fuscotomentosus]KAG1893065.1 hypothetical protein F5891DRAFT_986206 [Suillus fuscotomentosus]